MQGPRLSPAVETPTADAMIVTAPKGTGSRVLYRTCCILFLELKRRLDKEEDEVQPPLKRAHSVPLLPR